MLACTGDTEGLDEVVMMMNVSVPMGNNLSSENFMELNFSGSPHRQVYTKFGLYVKRVIIPIVFAIGIIGNISNLLILCRKPFRRGLNNIEKSALRGLIVLSLSDLMFCIVGLPTAFLPTSHGHSSLRVVGFFYDLYRTPVLNIFLFTSTWLIVWISMERYMAVCHPFQARLAIRPRRSTAVHLIIFVLSIAINIPIFLTFVVKTIPCPSSVNSCTCYMYFPTSLVNGKQALRNAHKIIWAVLGTIIPLVSLTFCNIRILSIVCRTDALASSDGTNNKILSRVTTTLVVMVFLYLILVTPSMVLMVISGYVKHFSDEYLAIGINITNLCQAIKFSSNFILYCVTNKQFRDNVGSVVCKTPSSKTITRESSTTKRYQLLGPGGVQQSDTVGSPPIITGMVQLDGLDK